MCAVHRALAAVATCTPDLHFRGLLLKPVAAVCCCCCLLLLSPTSHSCPAVPAVQINHPLDCPICDQGGECDLQDQVCDRRLHVSDVAGRRGVWVVSARGVKFYGGWGGSLWVVVTGHFGVLPCCALRCLHSFSQLPVSVTCRHSVVICYAAAAPTPPHTTHTHTHTLHRRWCLAVTAAALSR